MLDLDSKGGESREVGKTARNLGSPESELFSKYSKNGVVTKESIVKVMDTALDKKLQKIMKHCDKNSDHLVNKDGK